jgi:magnesium chelatase family protein
LPQLNTEQAMASASIQSLSNQGFQLQNWGKVPFRSPHHSTSAVALVGGGSNPKPGEISLAHNGVLFLDELPEFDRKVLEVLREPLEAKKINIARANHRVEYLADFQLIAAMNPCPCGYAGHPQQSCTCSVEQINRYRAKISGPLLDRIDIVVEVPSLNTNELQQLPNGEDSEQIKQRVINARRVQLQRQNKLNYELSNDEIERYCALNDNAKILMQQLIERNSLSARGYYRQLKLARTIADLAGDQEITNAHLALASQYKRNI